MSKARDNRRRKAKASKRLVEYRTQRYLDSLFGYLTSAVQQAAQHIVSAFGRLVNGFRRVAQAMETASEWAMRRFSAALLAAPVDWDAVDVIDQELDVILQVENTPEFAAVAKRLAAVDAERGLRTRNAELATELAAEGAKVPT